MIKPIVKNGFLYFLTNNKIICIDRLNKTTSFSKSNNKHEYLGYNVYPEDKILISEDKKNYILLENAKLEGKLLYLYPKEISLIASHEIKGPLLINDKHIK